MPSYTVKTDNNYRGSNAPRCGPDRPMPVHSSLRDRFSTPSVTLPRPVDAITAPDTEPLSIDELIIAALKECEKLPGTYNTNTEQIRELHSRLAYGRLHLAVVGEFNRGKSTFINALIGNRLLPTSILPITAVPTRLLYAPTLSCTVSFFNGKPDLVVQSSRELITETLLRYVAEENNPKNRLCVESVEVKLPSPLLENGTVLIDTPGFGSTYLHNTKTALDALADCDAVLFILSSDPPMTQTEVEFLKQVTRQVPRIFFILNKVDLLTAKQTVQVEEFMRPILQNSLKSSEPPPLFRVCARKAESALLQSPSDFQWASSGMEAVRQDIITFMAREKYFTLCEALNDKLRTSIGEIIAQLKKELEKSDAPFAQLNREREELAGRRDSIQKTMERETALCAAEKKALLKFFDDQVSAARPKLLLRLREAFSILLNSSSCSADGLSSVTLAFNNIFSESFSSFTTKISASLNRPVKKALLLHGKEAQTVIGSMGLSKIAASVTAQKQPLPDRLDAMELDLEERSSDAPEQEMLLVKPHWNDVFYSKKDRVARIHGRCDHRLEELFQNRVFNMVKLSRQKIDALFTEIEELVVDEYGKLLKTVGTVLRSKEEAIAAALAENNRSATAITAHIDSFERILQMLH